MEYLTTKCVPIQKEHDENEVQDARKEAFPEARPSHAFYL